METSSPVPYLDRPAHRPFGVALLGLGNVGSAVARVLLERRARVTAQVGTPVELRWALVRDAGKPRRYGLPTGLLTTDLAEVLGDPAVDLVVEVMGGERPALDYVRAAIGAGKHVVTANKELVAKHGNQLLAWAQRHNVDFHYEASVAGGVPIIANLKQDLIANRILSVRAIVNGTTNYILSRMAESGCSLAEALAEAQALGYAEPDPTNDVGGTDAAYKLTVLANLAFQFPARPEDVQREGILDITNDDVALARELGYAIKPLAVARVIDSTLDLRVHPALVPLSSLIAQTQGNLNIVEVEGDLVGKVTYAGQGAGPEPTASAIVADVIDICQDLWREYGFHSPIIHHDTSVVRAVAHVGESTFYLRLTAEPERPDESALQSALAEAGLSTRQVVARAASGGRTIALLVGPVATDRIPSVRERLGTVPGVLAVAAAIRVEE